MKCIVRVFSGTRAVSEPCISPCLSSSASAVDMKSPYESKQNSVMVCTSSPSGSTDLVTTSGMEGISTPARRVT